MARDTIIYRQPQNMGEPARPRVSPEHALPAAGRAKLAQIREAADAAHDPIPRLSDERVTARSKVMGLESQLRRRRAEWGNFDGTSEAVDLERELAAAKTELQAVEDRYNAAVAKAAPARQLAGNVNAYLTDLRRTKVLAHTGAAPRLKKGVSPLDQLERTRREIRRLRAELDETRAAPATASEAKAKATAIIDAKAAAGAPNVYGLLERSNDGIDWPEVAVDALSPVGDEGVRGTAYTADAIATLAWLFRDAIIAKVHAEIDAAADPEHALSTKERAAREAQILADMLELAREEEAYVEHLAEQGLTVARRPDADPRAILCLNGSMPLPPNLVDD